MRYRSSLVIYLPCCGLYKVSSSDADTQPIIPGTVRLLDTLSQILTGQAFRPLGAPLPKHIGSNKIRALNLIQVCIVEVFFLTHVQATGGGQPPETLVLALKVLGTFDFSGEMLLPLFCGLPSAHPNQVIPSMNLFGMPLCLT